MGKVIVYKNENDGVSIIYPSQSWKGTLEELAEECAPKGCEWRVEETGNLPLANNKEKKRQRTFRDAWVYREEVEVEMERAKGIHTDNIRRKREQHLQDLDKEILTHERDGKPTKELMKRRKELLEATDAVKNGKFKSQEELYQTWPSILEKRKRNKP